LYLWRYAVLADKRLIALSFYDNYYFASPPAITTGEIRIPTHLRAAYGRSCGCWRSRMRSAEFDVDQLESLMVTAFEMLGKPEGEARELARAILRAAERPQSGDPESPDRDPTRRIS
jgi:hypothetical protein